MKQLKLTLAILFLLMTNALAAHDFEAKNDDGVNIYYNIISEKDKTVAVTFGPDYNTIYRNHVSIPSKVSYNGSTYSVTSIGRQAFYDCTGLTSIEIPNSITSIDTEAFFYCANLRKVIVHDIGSWCGIKFSAAMSNPLINGGSLYSDKDTKITSIIIPNSVTSIGNFTFYGYLSLTSVTIPSTVTNIGHSAFFSCSALTSINIPNSVTSIGDMAFTDCSNLTSVTIPNAIKSISNSTFSGCSKLTSVTIPNTVTTIGSYAFAGCSKLTSINIPNSVRTINEKAFKDCSSLTSVSIPKSVTTIGGFAFSGCSGLKSAGPIGGGFDYEYGWNGTIPSYAFNGCSGLTSVTIPNSVTSIGNEAFNGCYRLHTINCLNATPPTCYGTKTFSCSTDNVRDQYDVYNFATLHVPMGSKEIYSSAHEWRYFCKIKEDMEMNGKVYYTTLTVQNGTTGYTRQNMKSDETYTIFIGSLGENKVNAVTFNGTDVTDEVDNGYYTTPELKKESILSISYEIPSGVNSLSLNDVKVTGYNGEITVKNIDEASDVFVYSPDGKTIANKTSALGTVSLQVPAAQPYIVKVGKRIFKVAL